MQGHDEIVWAVEIHNQRLFSASADKTIRVWDIASKRCERVSSLRRLLALLLDTSAQALLSTIAGLSCLRRLCSRRLAPHIWALHSQHRRLGR